MLLTMMKGNEIFNVIPLSALFSLVSIIYSLYKSKHNNCDPSDFIDSLFGNRRRPEIQHINAIEDRVKNHWKILYIII